MNMEWAADIASTHPDLHGAFINIEDEWLDVLLADGRSFRFRPGHMLDSSLSLEEQRTRLIKLISIGVEQAEKDIPKSDELISKTSRDLSDEPLDDPLINDPNFDPLTPDFFDSDEVLEPVGPEDRLSPAPLDPDNSDSVLAHLMPIVRSADFFISSHDHAHDNSIIYVPLTPFIGAGIAVDDQSVIKPLFFSDAERLNLPHDIVAFFHKALTHLRTSHLTNGQPSVEVRPCPIAGAQVYEFAGPASYRSSWFLDVEMAVTIAASMGKEHGDSLPLFIPARHDSFYIVMADDPALPSLFTKLMPALNSADVLYPLPHVVTADGWSEWIPMDDHPTAAILAKLRATIRSQIYQAQSLAMHDWPGDFGVIAPCKPIQTDSGISSCAQWNSSNAYGSVPDTEFIAFVREGSPHPWDADKGEVVLLRSHVARDIWHEGFSEMSNVWPPRWSVKGFPDVAQLAALKEASNREI